MAISRSMDYRHHWHDILVGSSLGVVVSFFAYRQYYPSLASDLCHRPYSPRIKDPEDAGLSPSSTNQGGILPLHLGNTSNASGYKPTQTAAGVNNRYDTTPSPPPGGMGYNRPSHQQQSSTSSGQPNPFVQPHAPHTAPAHTGYTPPHGGGYAEASYELDGTIPRPGQGHLHDQWKQGGGVDGTVPRGSTDGDDDVEPYGGYKRETAFQPRQQSSGLT